MHGTKSRNDEQERFYHTWNRINKYWEIYMITDIRLLENIEILIHAVQDHALPD